MVKGEAEAKKLCATGLRFGGVIRLVERYWEAGPSSICMTCCGIRHQRMGNCGDRPHKCIICAGPHKVEDHQCGIKGCKKRGKICVHVTPKCANCIGAHVASSARCPSRHQAEIRVRKEKKANEKGKEKVQTENMRDDSILDSPNPNFEMRIDNGKEKSALEPEEETLTR